MTKYAVITGASSGIGLEFTKLLAADGYDMLIAARDGKVLRTLAKELASEHKTKATTLTIDLSTHGAAEKLWKNWAHKKSTYSLTTPDLVIMKMSLMPTQQQSNE